MSTEKSCSEHKIKYIRIKYISICVIFFFTIHISDGRYRLCQHRYDIYMCASKMSANIDISSISCTAVLFGLLCLCVVAACVVSDVKSNRQLTAQTTRDVTRYHIVKRDTQFYSYNCLSLN